MESKKSPKPIKRDKNWQKKVEKRVKSEKINLDHPNGKERFDQAIKYIAKKKEA